MPVFYVRLFTLVASSVSFLVKRLLFCLLEIVRIIHIGYITGFVLNYFRLN